MLNLEEARLELSTKSYLAIEEATAWKWASRAAAAFEAVVKAKDRGDKDDAIQLFMRGDTYLGEAKEHAAQVGSIFLEKIEIAVGPYHMDAVDALYAEGE